MENKKIILIKLWMIFSIINLFCSYGLGQDDSDSNGGFSPVPVGSSTTGIVKMSTDVGNNGFQKSTISGSGNTRIIQSTNQLPLLFDKYTKNLITNYYKLSNIPIRLRILKVDPSIQIHKAFIQEEIPDGFNCIYSNPKGSFIKTSDNTTMLTWNLDEIDYIVHLDYVLSTNISGTHRIIGTPLTATIVDDTGFEQKKAFVSNDLDVNIIDRPPDCKGLGFENPIIVKKRKPLTINAIFGDPDEDAINCSVLMDNVSINVPITKSIMKSNKSGKCLYLYNFNLSKFTDKDRSFMIAVDDGEMIRRIGPFEIDTFNFDPRERDIPWGQIISPLGGGVFVLLAGLFNYRKTIWKFLCTSIGKVCPNGASSKKDNSIKNNSIKDNSSGDSPRDR